MAADAWRPDQPLWCTLSTAVQLTALSVPVLFVLSPQFAFNTLQRVSPVSHGVCNVVKRVAIIISSVFFFNQVLTTQTMLGTVIALGGTWLYTETSSKHKHAKPAAEEPPAGNLTPKAA